MTYSTKIQGIGDGRLQINHSQDCTELLEDNQRLRNEGAFGNDMKLAARIPMNLIFIWEQEGIKMNQVGVDPEMTARFWRKLQSPEWAKLRIWEGRVV